MKMKKVGIITMIVVLLLSTVASVAFAQEEEAGSDFFDVANEEETTQNEDVSDDFFGTGENEQEEGQENTNDEQSDDFFNEGDQEETEQDGSNETNEQEIEYETEQGRLTLFDLDQNLYVEFEILDRMNTEDLKVMMEGEEMDLEMLEIATTDRSVHGQEIDETDETLLISPNIDVNELAIEFPEAIKPVNVVELDAGRSEFYTVQEIDYEMQAQEEQEETQEADAEAMDEETGMGTNLMFLTILMLLAFGSKFAVNKQ